ncbi:alpha/beta fold hydrolase [Leuconostoc citreum]|uniref:alpha/beta fold hydrolase n=1 Tax=Leuconostoc citreum TaxID=33964 RepID=UPI0002465BED|nr:alpha/beta fold hydrolase [Leuconostoc citreum]CCF26597.1 Cell surface hydrolase [Leuconostoc citreum LBAE C11]
MGRKKIVIVGLIFLVIVAAIAGFLRFNMTGQRGTQTVILLHGYGSSSNATTKLAKAIQKQTAVQKRLQVNVTKDDNFNVAVSSKAAIYQMNFSNTEITEEREVAVLEKLLKQIKQKGIDHVSLVGHSMGANVALYTSLNHDYRTTSVYPKIDKLVAIAAPFNSGITAAGFDRQFDNNTIDSKTKQPKLQDENYRFFYQHRQNMNPDMQILNVMGDVGDNSDGVVTNFSSQALGFFVKKDQNYNMWVVKGKKVQHSQVRTNDTVVRQIAKFITKLSIIKSPKLICQLRAF